MEKIFNIDSPFNRIMTKVFDMAALNLMFLLCCIPIITIGASCTALHDVTLKMAAGKESYIIRRFLRAFCDNFKQATLTWIILLLAGALLFIDFAFTPNEGIGGIYMRWVFVIMTIVYLFVMQYIFQLQARYHNTIGRNVKNALLIAIRQFPKTILLIVIAVAPILLAAFGPAAIFRLWVVSIPTIAFSGIAYIHDKFIIKILACYEEIPEKSE